MYFPSTDIIHACDDNGIVWFLTCFHLAVTNSATVTTPGQNRLLALNYVYPGEDTMVCAAHSAWGVAFQSRFSQLPARLLTAGDRWGYFRAPSPDRFGASLCHACVDCLLAQYFSV